MNEPLIEVLGAVCIGGAIPCVLGAVIAELEEDFVSRSLQDCRALCVLDFYKIIFGVWVHTGFWFVSFFWLVLFLLLLGLSRPLLACALWT